jgi:hypothetical protein
MSKKTIKFSELVDKHKGSLFERKKDGETYSINNWGEVVQKGIDFTDDFDLNEDVIIDSNDVGYGRYGGKRKKRNTKSKTKIRKTKKSNKKFRQTKSKSR